jgi:hypothetical protein
MKLSRVGTGLVAGLALLLAGSAFAANKSPLTLSDAVTVNGQALPAGNYQLKWDGNGPEVQLSIVQGSKVVATTPARIVPATTANGSDSVGTRNNADGSKALTEIRVYGKKYTLAVGNTTQASVGQ